MNTAMAAAKHSIENNAGDHQTHENENDALQRHGVLLLPAYALVPPRGVAGAERTSRYNSELY